MSEEKFSVKVINNNRPSVVQTVQTYVNDIVTLKINWKDEDQRNEAAYMIDDLLDMYSQDTNGDISQINVLCDTRNNTRENLTKKGYPVFLDVHFTLRHSLNVTKICYTITG